MPYYFFQRPFCARRFYQRYFVDQPTSLFLGDDERSVLRMSDLSARGAGIFTDYPLEQGAMVSLKINASGLIPQPVQKSAKVVWGKQLSAHLWRFGLDFGELDKITLNSA